MLKTFINFKQKNNVALNSNFCLIVCLMHVAHLYVSKQINSCTLLVSGKVINEEKNVFLAQREFKILIN